MITEKDVLAALSAVPGPDGRTPLSQSGLVGGISVQSGKVYVTITADPGQAKALEPVRQAAEEAVKRIPGAAGALVMLTADRPAGSAPQGRPAPAGPGPRAQAATAKAGIPGVGKIIAVASGKGGVGKSTTAANLALAPSRLGLRVGVPAADIYRPSMPQIFGLHDKPVVVAGRTQRAL
ncbi:P-loop NTPase, partial [Nostoc sp. NIES-2111]